MELYVFGRAESGRAKELHWVRIEKAEARSCPTMPRDTRRESATLSRHANFTGISRAPEAGL